MKVSSQNRYPEQPTYPLPIYNPNLKGLTTISDGCISSNQCPFTSNKEQLAVLTITVNRGFILEVSHRHIFIRLPWIGQGSLW